MLFNSLAFAVFLPIVFVLYWGLSRKALRYQHAVLLLASYFFYGSWDPRFLGLIILSSVADYVIGLQLHEAENPQIRKRWLLLSLGINLGILGVFKYFNFFAESFGSLLAEMGLQASPFTLNIILPVGISFYTFQTLSYTIDIYRKKLEPTQDALAFFTFVAFFPQLVAGPIERAANLLPQFEAKRTFSREQASSGLQMILWGLVKKIVLADHLALYVDPVFANPGDFTGPVFFLATLAFGIQIYCDFSGYSDIAIGTARLFGFDLMINFKTPYFSTSIREFWSRWHISLSTWFRDYVYIALGGNRSSAMRWRANILLTFLLSGLWHGANITFVIWGLIHGLVYLLEHSWKRILGIKGGAIVGGLLTFLVVNLAWVFFRADSLSKAWQMLGGMGYGWGNVSAALVEWGSRASTTLPAWGLIGSVVIAGIIEYLLGEKDIPDQLASISRPVRWAIYYAMLIWLLLLGSFEEPQTFIYFQF